MPQDDKGKQFYDFVASKGIKVPPTYDEFAQSMRDTAIAEKFHGYVQSQDIKVPELNTFISTFSPSEPVKKKTSPNHYVSRLVLKTYRLLKRVNPMMAHLRAWEQDL